VNPLQTAVANLDEEQSRDRVSLVVRLILALFGLLV